tara:strand:- start:236 stop:448 length:213 start_codon:yes stop_codon:yes gene_type:complete
MNEKAIFAMLEDTANLSGDTGSYVAQNLMCCVLEISKHDGKNFLSGYFFEKLDKALKEFGYVCNSLEEEE